MDARHSFENKIFWKSIIKSSSKKFPDPVPFYGQEYEEQKWPGISHQSFFRLQNIFRKVPFLMIYHLGNFDVLMQSSSRAIPKIKKLHFLTCASQLTTS